MTRTDTDSLLSTDRALVWHPYSAIDSGMPVFPVVSASGVRLRLADGRELIDGMASWWCMIHGYNHPVPVSYTHLTLPTRSCQCRSRWSPDH